MFVDDLIGEVWEETKLVNVMHISIDKKSLSKNFLF